jgi:hypothetical protein
MEGDLFGLLVRHEVASALRGTPMAQVGVEAFGDATGEVRKCWFVAQGDRRGHGDGWHASAAAIVSGRVHMISLYPWSVASYAYRPSRYGCSSSVGGRCRKSDVITAEVTWTPCVAGEPGGSGTGLVTDPWTGWLVGSDL